MTKAVATPIKVELKDSLAGHHIEVDPTQVTMGLLEDLQGGTAGSMLDALVSTIVGGDLPHGTDRAGLRKLTPEQFGELSGGVVGATRLPKS